MAEPQPSEIQEGAAVAHAPTATAADRKAAATLSSLDAQDDNGGGKKGVEGKALDQAMKNLNVKDAKVEAKTDGKVEMADVNLLIKELNVNKQTATDLLKRYEGSAVKAMSAFVAGRA
ncbi:uncharacterized protein M421DRAFT_354 [Didymella exigua CBS 183.55]|uniref:Nascent polypeptide-associated complex subunit alpha-like UBA domain-containing protein n=1 Tax=Didymella exigua CBS 183.55 TaxID=1150837 RepID=A0A6A5S9R1_9PLEO|nr:uncharacterized protein M421DRAFT_354 [Didymella exigua CBS 183.55]KAF1934207.1 hypothetical protein M421DRAFT_354 [Didymella exigua CBS 183.55]